MSYLGSKSRSPVSNSNRMHAKLHMSALVSYHTPVMTCQMNVHSTSLGIDCPSREKNRTHSHETLVCATTSTRRQPGTDYLLGRKQRDHLARTRLHSSTAVCTSSHRAQACRTLLRYTHETRVQIFHSTLRQDNSGGSLLPPGSGTVVFGYPR